MATINTEYESLDIHQIMAMEIARKDAIIDKIKARNAELIEALERIKASSVDKGVRLYCSKILSHTSPAKPSG